MNARETKRPGRKKTRESPGPMEPALPGLRRRPWISLALTRWYQAGHRDLAWRRTKDPYAIWVSEIMLQQTQVEAVLPYYTRFLQRFPGVRALAEASRDEVLKLWEGLGYYARARHLHEAARRLVENGNGQVPDTLEGLLALPGVGRSTAGSILCFAHGERHPVLDGNVKRVLLRLYDLHADKTAPPVERWLWSAAETLLADAERPDDYNQALLDLGATVCRPRSPRCQDCPLRRGCAALRAGTQSALPLGRAPKARPHHTVVVAVLSRRRPGGEEILIQQRPPEGLLGGLWELPGGKCKPGETLPEALRREITEELGVEIEVGRELISLDHAYTHFSITLHAFLCRLRRGRPRALAAQELRWVTREALGTHAFPRANQRVLERLLTDAP